MRDVYWIPRKDRSRPDIRPYLEVPSPYAYMPPRDRDCEREREEQEEAESPRVIIIDI